MPSVASTESAVFWLSPVPFTNPNAIPVWIGQVDLPCPGLLLDLYAELIGNRINRIYVKVNQSVWPRVALVFGEVKVNVATSEKQVEG